MLWYDTVNRNVPSYLKVIFSQMHVSLRNTEYNVVEWIIFRTNRIIYYKGLSHAVEFILTDKKASESKAIFKRKLA